MAKPFVKWVGGKRQLLPQLFENLPFPLERLKELNYIEPFVGGGALFFALEEKGLKSSNAILNDFNPELFNLYIQVQNHPHLLFERLSSPDFIHSLDSFNKIRAWDRDSDFLSKYSDIDRAARFVFLNRTAFNGLWRVNKNQQFNTPFGRYKSFNIPSLEQLLSAQNALNGTQIFNMDFEDICKMADENSFVYLDPPYIPVSASSSFTNYTNLGFDLDMQKRLVSACKELTEKGVMWMLSNSYTSMSLDLFGSIPNSKHKIIKASRQINADKSKRGKIDEYLFLGGLS